MDFRMEIHICAERAHTAVKRRGVPASQLVVPENGRQEMAAFWTGVVSSSRMGGVTGRGFSVIRR